jgi:indole-3-glycerol phosphate synthase
MNILDKIIARKNEEVLAAKAITSVQELEQSSFFSRKPISLKSIYNQSPKAGIIAEHKRKSPSKGIINDSLSVEFITQGYVNAGAYCLSVLTDSDFFAGSKDDLISARKANLNTPILRKDFIVDEYQILEAKAWGADVILLIAANLEPKQLLKLAQFAKSLHLEVLMEVHDKVELEASLNDYIDLVGVNNRNLKTFEVSIDTSLQLANLIPNTFIKVAESGINHADEIKTLYKAGFKGFLIGESFMKTSNPGEALAKLIRDLY